MNEIGREEYFRDLKVIGFDADDTLWVNETYFREAEERFRKLIVCFETENMIQQELFKVEMQNLGIYGYGVKGFVLSMIECALLLSNNKLEAKIMSQILDIGKEMLNKQVELLPNVESTIQELSKSYRLLLLTKGDLLDQERKLEKSGLSKYFHHVEVLSNKHPSNYKNLLEHLKINTDEFLMVGNSLKSDVLPVVELGARAVHVPFHTTWEHEQVENVKDAYAQKFVSINSIKELKSLL